MSSFNEQEEENQVASENKECAVSAPVLDW